MANPFTRIRTFFNETVSELKKASWPTKTELRDSTLVVLVATLLLGFYISLADFSIYGWVTLLTDWARGG